MDFVVVVVADDCIPSQSMQTIVFGQSFECSVNMHSGERKREIN